MPADLFITARVTIAGSELTERFSRSSGPGGQGVNTTDSRVELSVNVARSRSLPSALRQRALTRLADRLVDGVLTVSASEQRHQLANRAAARAKLADLLRAAIAPPPRPRRPTKPSKAAVQRRLTGKRRRSILKQQRTRQPGPDD